MEITVGMKGEVATLVEREDTAKEVGSGSLLVYATPCMVALMEGAACEAIADALSDSQTTVGTALKCLENKHGVHAAGAGNADDLDLRRIGEAVASRKVSARIGAPVAAKRHDQRLIFFYLHIASTSAIICLVENPFKSIAPDGQVTVQAPQPWQRAELTTATLRFSLMPWSLISLTS